MSSQRWCTLWDPVKLCDRATALLADWQLDRLAGASVLWHRKADAHTMLYCVYGSNDLCVLPEARCTAPA